jgi:hypothetical protein
MGILRATLLGLAAVVIAVLTALRSGRDPHPSPTPTRSSAASRHDHIAVEEQIENRGHANVVCNHGEDLPIIVHAQFTCIAAGHQQILVTITTASRSHVWGPSR